jgi:glucosamine-6-phosphate deaminase
LEPDLRIERLPAGSWPGAVVDAWEARHAGGPLRMMLPTGGTPRPVYRELARRGPDLTDSEVFILDEFLGLPAGHPARCDSMIEVDLIGLLERPPVLHTLDPDAVDLAAEIAGYEAAIDAAPVDLVMLGLGANGHVALNEPGSTPEQRARIVDLHPTTIAGLAASATPAPTQGATLGLGNILDAEEVWLLVTGRAKAAILAEAVEGPVGPGVPASYLRTHPNAVVYADEEAAAALSGAK